MNQKDNQHLDERKAIAMLSLLNRPNEDSVTNSESLKTVKDAVDAHLEDKDGSIAKNVHLVVSYRRFLESEKDSVSIFVRIDSNNAALNSSAAFINYRAAVTPEARRASFIETLKKMNVEGKSLNKKLDKIKREARTDASLKKIALFGLQQY